MQQFVSSIFHYLAEVLEVIYHAKGTVFILQHLLLPCFIASGLWLSWENLKGTVFIWGKLLQPCSFKVLTYSTELASIIVVCTNPIFSWWMCWFDNSQQQLQNCSYLLSIVNFWRHLSLQAWLSEELLSPKSRSFGVFSLALIFFLVPYFLGTATVKMIYLKH